MIETLELKVKELDLSLELVLLSVIVLEMAK